MRKLIIKKKFLLTLLVVFITTFVFAKANVGENEDTQRKFWGWSCNEDTFTGYQWCCYYVFWINTGCDFR